MPQLVTPRVGLEGSWDIIMFVDPAEGLHGPLRPAYLLARELRGRYDVTFVTPSPETAEAIRSAGLNAVSFNRRYFLRGSLRALYISRDSFSVPPTT